MPHLSPAPDGPAPTQTALIVAVSPAERVVAEHRRHLDPVEAWGVPAHLTVLYPFVEPADVDDSVLARLALTIEPIEAFDCRFSRTQWFGEDVLWLEPDPAEPFSQLTEAVWEAFPACPPYGGIHQGVVPHLTIGERRQAGLAALRAAEQSLQPELPVSARIDQVLLIAGTQAAHSWRVLQRLDLGTSGAPTD